MVRSQTQGKQASSVLSIVAFTCISSRRTGRQVGLLQRGLDFALSSLSWLALSWFRYPYMAQNCPAGYPSPTDWITRSEDIVPGLYFCLMHCKLSLPGMFGGQRSAVYLACQSLARTCRVPTGEPIRPPSPSQRPLLPFVSPVLDNRRGQTRLPIRGLSYQQNLLHGPCCAPNFPPHPDFAHLRNPVQGLLAPPSKSTSPAPPIIPSLALARLNLTFSTSCRHPLVIAAKTTFCLLSTSSSPASSPLSSR